MTFGWLILGKVIRRATHARCERSATITFFLMSRLRLRFRLATLLALMTLAAVGSALLGRSIRFQRLAREHQRAALVAGYAAFKTQQLTHPDSMWAAVKFEEPPLKWDLASVQSAATSWRIAMHHTQMRDKYLAAARTPWRPVASDPPAPSPLDFPLAEELAQSNWQSRLAEFLKQHPYFSLKPYVFEGERDAKVLNVLGQD